MTFALRAVKPAIAVGAVTAIALILSGCAPVASEGSDTTTLKMVFEPGPEADAMSVLVDAFNAGAGKDDGISVEITQLSRTDTYAKEAAVMSTKSSDYDLYRTASYLVAQHAPYLEPIDIDESQYFTTAVDSLKVDDKLYGVPLDVSNHFLYYRTDLIDTMLADEAGFEAISLEAFGTALQPKSPDDWTWEDYLASAAYFTKKYNADSPTEYGTILQAKNLVYNAMVWDDVLWSFGGGWLDSDGKPDLNSDAAKKAVAVYSDAYTAGVVSADSSQAEYPETQAALTSGNAAFAIQWGAAFAGLNDPDQSPLTAGKIGVAPIPGDIHQTHVHTLSVGINKYGENKDAAKKFIEYLAMADTMTTYVGAGGIAAMPTVLDANAEVNPLFPYLSRDMTENSFAEPNVPRAFDIYTMIADKLSAAWVGEADIDDSVDAADDALADLINK
ncbi:extracellular solute-binding protein [Cryobacterium sp. TMT1-2-2]|uniref:ABC transporter substrate-binding protein n=1 Tax=Cryobacterium sp. TMT1-2-2 TaxID=1259233 RepID=UPI00106CCB03|nr:extracellular solute-binding protein [Cryobacterium sp. TMT1-2-2]TFD07897.1 extracellular solute-binding protein [Cryobacterium sp. TMT1-2-2]